MKTKQTIMRSAGETEAGSAGTQLARDSRPGWTIARQASAKTAAAFPKTKDRLSPMPEQNPLAEGKVLRLECLLTKKSRVQFTLNQYTRSKTTKQSHAFPRQKV